MKDCGSPKINFSGVNLFNVNTLSFLFRVLVSKITPVTMDAVTTGVIGLWCRFALSGASGIASTGGGTYIYFMNLINVIHIF